MKTTLILADAVMARLKRKALDEGRSISSIVEEAVQQYMAEGRRRPPALPPLPSYDGGGFKVDVSNRDALYDALDRD